MTGSRRKARIVAFQTLYEVDCVGHDPEKTLSRQLEESSLPQEVSLFARELVEGVLKNKDKIDAVIQAHAPTWPVAQLPIVDRNILRLAIFEILISEKVPLKVAINEAVELAKIFGSDSSPRFINGVLGSVSKLILEKST